MNDFIDSLGLVSGPGAFYEDWRQEELTMALGQVQCRGTHNQVGLFWSACPDCGAAL